MVRGDEYEARRIAANIAKLPELRLLILGLYSFIICFVAAMLYVAVNNLEPDRREATALTLLFVGLAGAGQQLIQAIFTENSPMMAKRKQSRIIRKPVAPPINEWEARENRGFLLLETP